MISNKTFLRSIFLFFTVVYFSSFTSQAQEKTDQITDSLQVKDLSIKISDIPEETEKLGQRILKLNEILKPSKNISRVDSLLAITSSEINLKKDSLFAELQTINRRKLKVKKVTWLNYQAQLNEYKETLRNRNDELSTINDEIVEKIKKWEYTRDKLAKNSSSDDIYKGLDQVIETLQTITKNVHKRIDSVFIVQNGLTNLVLTIDEVISEIEITEHQLQKDYFIFDSKPLWALGSSKFYPETLKDSTLTANDSIISVREPISIVKPKTPVRKEIKESAEELKEFIISNIKTFTFQVIFILLLYTFMYNVNRKWTKKLSEISNPVEIQAKIVFSNPLSSSIVVGLLFSSFFYKALIPVFTEIHIILILISTFYLLPKLTDKRFKIFISLMFIVYFIQTFQAYISHEALTIRLLMIFEVILLIFAFRNGRSLMLANPERFTPIYKLFKAIAPIYTLLLVISLIANTIGMVALSNYLIFSVLLSTVLGLVIHLTVKIIISLFALLFKLRKTSNLESVTTMVKATNKRIQPLLIWAGFIVWIMFTLRSFDLSIFFSAWINDLMVTKWKIGETVISLGGILAFISIIIITIVVAKIIANIFQDNWMVNTLPRGLASAISLLLRIFIVACGFYIAVTAAGIDLSKLSFLIGALGVGIGFGLQNVVLNFISGLILAFERPINIGDTIEVNQEFGVVTNIGVRSSTIKSYSGYESIIPNGDLISKKVNNYTLANRDRRSNIIMKTAPTADPHQVIELLNKIASNYPTIYKDPKPSTFFNGYGVEGNLNFSLIYWTTFSDTLKTDSDVALEIFAALKEAKIQAPAPVRRIVNEE